MGLSLCSLGGGGLANGRRMSFTAGKSIVLSVESFESLMDRRRPSLKLRRASLHVLLGPYMRLPSKKALTSFIFVSDAKRKNRFQRKRYHLLQCHASAHASFV